MTNLEHIKKTLTDEIKKRVDEEILEETNANLLIKLINTAENTKEAYDIAMLGTTYKRTGFHFDKRLEKTTDTIAYLKKDEDLSFVVDDKLVHKLIIGDNYPALLNLLVSYRGKIKVIYIDPPYGKDYMGDFAKTNYNNAISRDNLLSMLYPRLQVARELLTDDGVIFCSIDDRNQAYIKCLFDEVFGERNFIANVVWHSKNKPSGNTTENKSIDTRTEYILCYTKKEININKYENTQEDLNQKGYVFEDEYLEERGKYKLTPLMRSCSASSFKYLESLDYEIEAPDGTYFKNHQNLKNPKSYCYTWGKLLFDFGKKNGFIEIKKTSDGFWCAYRKMYEFCAIDNTNLTIIYRKSGNAYNNLVDDTVIKNIYSDSGANEIRNIMSSKIFANPKPINLIKHLLKIASDTDSIILDFFAGSGTTGQATLELNREDGGNRRFILITNNEVTDINPNGIAKDVTSKRLKRVMSGKCYDGTDNFKWLEKNEPYGNALEVTSIEYVSNKEQNKGKSAFEVIDERLYDLEKFENINDKIKWVCENFAITQKQIKED